MEKKYCWRCQCEVPLLNEEEWTQLSSIMNNMVKKVKEYRTDNNCDLKTAQVAVGNQVLEIYNNITGFEETNHLAIWHHRRSMFGPECKKCGHLLRTPKASYCANCGESRDNV